MNKIQTFEQFLTSQSGHVPFLGFVINLLLAALLSLVISYVYIHLGKSVSNRRLFASNFVLLAVTTTLIITIVKSSLALSLGLVGALSIVRFRAPIKEPEELTYLFLNIAIGLGLGADQRLITVVAIIFIIAFILLKSKFKSANDNQNLCLTICNDQSKPVTLDQIISILKKYCTDVQLRRMDETADLLEVSFLIACDDYKQLKESLEDFRRLNKSIKVNFLDNKGLI